MLGGRLCRSPTRSSSPFRSEFASAEDEQQQQQQQQPRSGIRDVMWVKEPVQQLGTIAYDRPPVDADPVTSRDAILGNANAFTAAKNRDCGGARPSAQNADLANEIGRCTFRCSNNNNSNNGRCTLSASFPDPRPGTSVMMNELGGEGGRSATRKCINRLYIERKGGGQGNGTFGEYTP